MKVAIIGATGTVGREVLKQALEQGHSVTALVRDPSKITAKNPDLQVVQGDVLDRSAVEKTVAGQEAVICILGAGRKGSIRAEGTRSVIRAMEKAGVKRLICQSSLGVGDSRGVLTFWWKYVMFGVLLRPAYIDHERQEEYVNRSGLDWTIIRPAAFTNGPFTGEYKHGSLISPKGLTLKISRADVADFLLKQLKDKTYIRKSPGLSY